MKNTPFFKGKYKNHAVDQPEYLSIVITCGKFPLCQRLTQLAVFFIFEEA